MATIPYFVISPNAILSIAGLLHGPDKTMPRPAEDWRDVTINVVIPCFNEEYNIALCLSSLMRQTKKPQQIMIIDDGSSDDTILYAKKFCEQNKMNIEIIHRKESIGKTPTLKRQAREYDYDVEFILDGDTILESDNYIERTVQELYQAVGIASACGTILPLRDKDRKALIKEPSLQKFISAVPDAPLYPKLSRAHKFMRIISNVYRDILYLFLQKFIYHGQMFFFGSITNPVGCAVAYRRKYVKELFDQYEPILGDDLTNSEDIFIGFSMLNHGYRNIQLMDVYARSQEPEATYLPRQIYMWSSSFLQSCLYFNSLLLSPFKVFKRRRHMKEIERKYAKEIQEKRNIQEPYRQPFGDEFTAKYGRPIGWSLLTSVMEKVFFPTAIIIMMISGLWEALLVTIAVETVLSVTILAYIVKKERLSYILKGIMVTPIRYASLLFDLFTMIKFGWDLWIIKTKRWRK